jgi:Glyoxalase-like domain
MHPELTSASAEEQQATASRALDLGARHIDVGQLPEEGHVVLADPNGDEFCLSSGFLPHAAAP